MVINLQQRLVFFRTLDELKIKNAIRSVVIYTLDVNPANI